MSVQAWGEIESPDRFRQPLIFDGLRYGTWRPTDIDAMMELNDRAYIFIEVKKGDKEAPTGQRLALQRLVYDTGRAGKKSLAMIVSHEVENPRQPVRLAECIVREVYYSGNLEWMKSTGRRTVEDVLGSYMNFLK